MEPRYEELTALPLMSYLPAEAMDVMPNCFELRFENINAGSTRSSKGRLGYLVSGRGSIRGRELRTDDVFGAGENPMTGKLRLVDEIFSAASDSRVLWLEGEILSNVCYRACWFHGRLVQELTRRLKEAR